MIARKEVQSQNSHLRGINPDLHRNIAVYAMEHDKILNAVIVKAIIDLLIRSK
jgi:hypothetical protein